MASLPKCERREKRVDSPIPKAAEASRMPTKCAFWWVEEDITRRAVSDISTRAVILRPVMAETLRV
jgi:hypothetical protein